MDRITTKQLLQQENIANPLDDIETARRKAHEVFELRDENADTVKKYMEDISVWAKKLTDYIKDITKKIGKDSYHKEESVSSDIIAKGNKIIEEIGEFKTFLSSMERKFRNKRIKVVSVGRSGTGKSTFTRNWTGLGEDVIHTHPDGDNQDCTGALCNFYYDSSLSENQFRGVVHFLSAKELVKRIDALYQDICRYPDVDETCGGFIKTDSFTDLSQVRDLIKKGFYIHVSKTGCWGSGDSKIKTEMKFAFAAYFKDDSYIRIFDGLNAEIAPEDKKDITTSKELDKYNWMQHEQACYMAVKSIDLFVNPREQKGLLEFFEIADTKGISDTTLANAEILDAISDSDAVFSVHLEQTGSPNRSFYTDILYSYMNDGNETLPDKHFVVFNKEIGLTQGSADKGFDVIDKTSTSNCLYEGCLKDEGYKDEYMSLYKENYKDELIIGLSKKFSVAVVIDMLERIASKVCELDTMRMQKCNTYILNLKTMIEAYLQQIHVLNLRTDFDEEQYVRNAILEMAENVRKYAQEKIDKLGYDPKNDDALSDSELEEEYEKVRKEQAEQTKKGNLPKEGFVHYISPYEFVCGRAPEKADDFDDTDGAMDVLCDSVAKEIEEAKEDEEKFCKADNYFVIYINEFIARIINRLSQSKGEATLQRRIDMEEEIAAVFSKIWTITHLNETLRKDPNRYVVDLNKILDDSKKKSEGLTTFPPFFNHYPILKDYFSRAEDLDVNAQNGDNIVDFDALKTVLKEQVRELEIKKRLARKYVDRKCALHAMYERIVDYFKHILTPPYRDQCIKFYMNHIELLTAHDKIHQSRIQQAEDDKRIIENAIAISKVLADELEKLQPLILNTKRN